MTNTRKLILMVFIAATGSAYASDYVVPPTSSTRTHVPVISDAAMEACVKLYNEAKWLSDKLERMNVNSYSQESINSYNNQVDQHSQMLNRFNKDCAGKQSRSAHEAAKRLNANQ